MQVEMWSLDRIKPYENNPRINDDAVDAVVQSINEFGFRQPIVVDKGPLVWRAIARQMGPQALRMNLNMLLRHDAFKKSGILGFAGTDNAMIDYVAGQLADRDAIARSRQFPYQYLAAYLNASDEVPSKIKTALHDAAEIACGNVPTLPGPVIIGLDTSGSMGCAVTGNRGRGGTSKMRCVDVAALFAAAILRRNPEHRRLQ